MIINKRLILIILLIGTLLLITPINAKVVTAKVDDKGLIAYGHASCSIVGTLHTEYGWIAVSDYDYNCVEINDTIKYDTDIDSFWRPTWDIEVLT
jgi:hypothetical protein